MAIEGKPAFMAGEGEMARRMQALPWAETSLGAPETWPQALRTSVRLMLDSRHPMYIWWGPELLCFYNDAYARSIGPERHPSSLGQPGRAVWEEIWPIIGPQIDQIMAGGSGTWHENALVPITRNGRLEDVYWTYGYSPIDEPSAPNGVGGVLVVCSETTQQVESLRLSEAEARRQRALLDQMPGFAAVLSGPEHVFTYVNEAYLAISGPRTFAGRTVREVFPELTGQGYYELLDTVYRTGERFVARARDRHPVGGGGPRPLYRPALRADSRTRRRSNWHFCRRLRRDRAKTRRTKDRSAGTVERSDS